jgi:hypothetical protein
LYQSESGLAKKVSVLDFFVSIALAVVLFVYLTIAIYVKDFLWIWPQFDAQPASAMIWCYGEKIAIGRNSAHLTGLARLVNEQISGKKYWDTLNLTDQTYQDYVTSDNVVILHLFYDNPERVHSQSPFFSGFDEILIPLVGRYANTNILFSLIQGKPAGGSMHVESFADVINYLADQGLCARRP